MVKCVMIQQTGTVFDISYKIECVSLLHTLSQHNPLLISSNKAVTHPLLSHTFFCTFLCSSLILASCSWTGSCVLWMCSVVFFICICGFDALQLRNGFTVSLSRKTKTQKAASWRQSDWCINSKLNSAMKHTALVIQHYFEARTLCLCELFTVKNSRWHLFDSGSKTSQQQCMYYTWPTFSLLLFWIEMKHEAGITSKQLAFTK